MWDMEPNLLMRAWIVAHLSTARYHAVVCCAGSAGEVAFREALYPQYKSHLSAGRMQSQDATSLPFVADVSGELGLETDHHVTPNPRRMSTTTNLIARPVHRNLCVISNKFV